MKIALIGNSFPPGFRGGTELVLAAQARELAAGGQLVDVICGQEGGGAPQVSVEGNLRIVRIPRSLLEESSPDWCRERVAAAVEEASSDCDIVHLHHWSDLSGDLVRRLSRRTPVVLSLHDHFASCPRFFREPLPGLTCPTSRPTRICSACIGPLLGDPGPVDLTGRLNERWRDFRSEIAAAAAVVCPSESLRASLAREMEFDARDWSVVPHGLCRPLGPIPADGRVGEELVVISFGNRARVKGTLDLVRAMSALPAGSARLILAGQEVEPGLDGDLRVAAGDMELEIHGPYDGDCLARLCAGADLAAFPSRAQESYGLVVEEALALGLPAWVSDRGALGEVLGRCAGSGPLPGAILPAARPEAWTKALRHLVESPGRLQDAHALLPAQPRTAADAVCELNAIYSDVLRRQTVQGT